MEVLAPGESKPHAKSNSSEKKGEENEREKNAVTSGHIVPCSAHKTLGPIYKKVILVLTTKTI